MAQLTRSSTYPNLLTLSGTDIVTAEGRLIRQGVRAALFSDNGVSNFCGKVDFIICFVVNGQGNSDFAPAAVDHTVSPRPLRGIIQLNWRQNDDGNPANIAQSFSPQKLGGVLTGKIGHEVAHYWLVPGSAKILTPSGDLVETPTPAQIADSLEAGDGLPSYPLIGRGDSHWSPYVDSRNSFMDGVNHSSAQPLFEASVGYAYAACEVTTGVTFNLPNFGDVTTPARLSELELYRMGVLAPPRFDPRRSYVNVIEPIWAFPTPFQSGLYLEADNDEAWYVGFHTGPHKLWAQSIDGTSQHPEITLSVPFNPYERVGLRIVQQGAEIKLQARARRANLYQAASGCLWAIIMKLLWLAQQLGLVKFFFPPNLPKPKPPEKFQCDDIMSDLATGSPMVSEEVYEGWKTLATIPARAKRVGLSARNVHVPGVGGRLCFVRTSAHPCLWDSQGIRTVPISSLNPEVNPIVLPDDTLLLRYREGPYLESPSEHGAPKLTMDAPNEDFAFGGDVKIERCLVTPHAGGAAVGKTLVGVRRQIPYSSFQWKENDEWLAISRQAPANGAYQFLFCLAAREESELLDSDAANYITGVDLMRRAWEPCFYQLTLETRRADTGIEL